MNLLQRDCLSLLKTFTVNLKRSDSELILIENKLNKSVTEIVLDDIKLLREANCSIVEEVQQSLKILDVFRNHTITIF